MSQGEPELDRTKTRPESSAPGRTIIRALFPVSSFLDDESPNSIYFMRSVPTAYLFFSTRSTQRIR